MMLCLFAPVTSYAEESNQKTVKVAYFESVNFQEKGSDDTIKSGYSYETLQEIANYTGWRYEYVYGDWADLFDRFKAGEIDMFAGLAYREDREPYMDWPERTIDLDYHSLFVRRDDPISSDNELNGKRIGVIRDNNMTREFLEWADEQGVNPEYVYYETIDPLTDELDNGNIDGFIGAENNIDRSRNVRCYVRYAETKSYICVRKGADDILSGLNYALESIELNNPDFFSNLKRKYFFRTTTNATLSAEELAWVNDHKVLRIGYLEDYLPFCSTDKDGNITGVIKDITDSWLKEMTIRDSLEIEYVVYPGHKELIEGLDKGEIDAAFPIPESAWNSESTGIMTSTGLFDLPMTVAFKGDYSDEIFDSIAIKSTGSVQQIFVKENYPDANIVSVDSGEGCLKAILDNKASCTVMTNVRIAGHLTKSGYNSIHYLPLDGSMTYCIGVMKGNTDLLGLIDRGIGLMDKSQITASMYDYIENFSTYGARDFIYDNLGLVLFITIGIILVIVILISVYFKAIKKSEKIAEEANLAKSQFLFNMSHDIRTPMNAITGYTRMAKKNIGNGEIVEDYLDKIELSGKQLLGLINQILEMSRIESGKIILQEEPADIIERSHAMKAVTETEADSKGLKLSLDFGEIKHSHVLVDVSRMNQIITNILGNAMKYTPEGGSVAFTVEELDSDRDGWGLYRFTVADTGIGMSEEYLKQIFDEFSRESTSTVSRIQGSGLGMSIVKKLIDLMGGSVDISSKPGEGTSISVTMHMKIDESAGNGVNDQSDYEGIDFTGKRILLVEDNEMNREIACDILEDAGFIVETAEDGDIAVEMVKATSERGDSEYYDVVLMDIQMPRMNGYEATKAIKALPDSQNTHLPIIALSANAFAEDRQKSIEAGMDDHIAKPIDIRQLKETLSKYL